MSKMTKQEVETFIAQGRQKGKTDLQIYVDLRNNPKAKWNFVGANKAGMSNEQIAQSLKLNVSPKADKVEYDKPTFKERFGAGMDNMFSGMKQGALYAKDKVTGGNSYDEYTQAKADEKAHYQDAKKQSGFSGIDVAETLGEIVATAPVALAGRGYQGAKFLSTQGAKITAQNAGLGAVGAGVGFAENADKRMNKMTVGAITAPVAGYVGEKLLGKPIAKMMTRHSVTDDVAKTAVNKGLAKEGLKLDDLPSDVADDLIKKAKTALKAGKTLDDDVVGRVGLMRKHGFNPTRGQATRRADDWGAEREVAKYSDELRGKFGDDNAGLVQMLDDMATATGGAKTGDAGLKDLSTNQQLIETAQKKIAQNKQRTKEAYDLAKNAVGNELPIDATAYVDDVYKSLGKFANDVLPAEAKSVLRTAKEQGLTFGESQELVKILNNAYKGSLNNGMPTMHTNALKQAKETLEAWQQKAIDGTNQNAQHLWQNARHIHKSNRQMIENMPLLRDVEKGVKTDELMDKYFLKSKNDELKRTISFLEKENPQLLADVRQSIIEHITSKAVGANGGFNPKGYADIIKNIRTDRLEAIFGADVAKQMKETGRVAHYLQQNVAGATTNGSNTAWGLVQVLNSFVQGRTGGLFDLNKMVGYRGAKKALHPDLYDPTKPITYTASGQNAMRGMAKMGVGAGVANADE